MFDLTRIQTLANVKEWYRQVGKERCSPVAADERDCRCSRSCSDRVAVDCAPRFLCWGDTFFSFLSHLTPRTHRQARGFNKSAAALLVGLKYDEFSTFPIQEQVHNHTYTLNPKILVLSAREVCTLACTSQPPCRGHEARANRPTQALQHGPWSLNTRPMLPAGGQVQTSALETPGT